MKRKPKPKRAVAARWGRCQCGNGANMQLSVGVDRSVLFVDGCRECVTRAGLVLVMAGLVWIGDVVTNERRG